MKVISTNIGKKTTLLWEGEEVITGILKKPTETPILLGLEDVQEDAVVDREYHGGIDQAVYAYGAQHYQYWQELYPEITMNPGFFGENLTIANLDEHSIHIDAIYELGTAIVQVTKPRQPCMKLGVVFGTQNAVKQFWKVSKSGLYFKILQEGTVKKGDYLKLIKPSENSKTIAEVFAEKRKKSLLEKIKNFFFGKKF